MVELEIVQKSVESYLCSKNWQRVENREGLVYVKNPDYARITEFRPTEKDTLKRRRFLEDFFIKTSEYFKNKGYEYIAPFDIRNPNEDTLFTIAGVQVLDSDRRDLEGDLFIAQPVIRTQYFGSANTKIGSSTSFVNICTEKVDAHGEDFIRQLDSWLNYLSQTGLYMGDMELGIKTKEPNWGKGPFRKLVVSVKYKSLGLGDLGYLHDVPQKKGKMNICDMGFGLERLNWAVNKTPSYYDILWPGRKILPLDEHQLDIIRTATLIVGSGIEPSNNNQGYRLRKFLKEYQGFREIDTSQLISDFFDYWKLFSSQKIDLNLITGIISKELNRNRNLRLLNLSGLNTNKLDFSLDPNNFARVLLER